MKKESEALNKLTNVQSKVSCHYLIKNTGKIVKLVPDSYVAWHAGKSSWKSFRSLNKSSIGIEISNPGHDFNYKKFSKKQIFSLLRLGKFLIKKYNIDSHNILGHSDIAPERKKDPGEKFPWKYLSKKKIGFWHSLKKNDLLKRRCLRTNNVKKESFYKNLFKIGYSKKIPKNLNKEKYLKVITKAFQRRFRQEMVNGIVDEECLFISKDLIKN